MQFLCCHTRLLHEKSFRKPQDRFCQLSDELLDVLPTHLVGVYMEAQI